MIPNSMVDEAHDTFGQLDPPGPLWKENKFVKARSITKTYTLNLCSSHCPELLEQ